MFIIYDIYIFLKIRWTLKFIYKKYCRSQIIREKSFILLIIFFFLQVSVEHINGCVCIQILLLLLSLTSLLSSYMFTRKINNIKKTYYSFFLFINVANDRYNTRKCRILIDKLFSASYPQSYQMFSKRYKH